MPADVAEALVVRPGDTLILRLASAISPEQYKRLRENLEPGLKEHMPGVEVIFLGGIEQMAVYRPDELAEGGPT
jgi:hypothetical protein